jgi:hypothetical protein
MKSVTDFWRIFRQLARSEKQRRITGQDFVAGQNSVPGQNSVTQHDQTGVAATAAA